MNDLAGNAAKVILLIACHTSSTHDDDVVVFLRCLHKNIAGNVGFLRAKLNADIVGGKPCLNQSFFCHRSEQVALGHYRTDGCRADSWQS